MRKSPWNKAGQIARQTAIAAVCLISALQVCSCVAPSPLGISANASNGITAERGAEQARKDIARGNLQLMRAGTRAAFAPNVPPDDIQLSKLPRRLLPSGCTTPDASLWKHYAEGYNAVVVEYVRSLK